MGIMEKLSDMRRKKLDEDWREDARAAKAAKSVEDFHRQRLKSLDYSIDTSFGGFKVKISHNWEDISVLRVYFGDEYLLYKNFVTIEELKKFIEEDLAEEIYKKIRESFSSKIQKMPRDEAKNTLRKFNSLVDELDKEIDLKIDYDELGRKLRRYGVYSKALSARDKNKSELVSRARRNFEEEHRFEVGDVVYGLHGSSLRDGKPYVIVEIEKNGKYNKKYWKCKVEPQNGRGHGATVYGRDIYLDSDAINTAVNNPDDPKYTPKFDQQQYMMDRYSADRQFDEAVELLNSCNMIVESK